MSIRTLSNDIKFAGWGNDDTPLAKSEANDCVVHAIAKAFDINYDVSHAFCRGFFNRKNRGGTRAVELMLKKVWRLFDKHISQIGMSYQSDYEGFWSRDGKKMVWPYKVKGVTKYAKYTVGKFLKDYPKGTYLILIKGHVFTIIDSVVYGNQEDARSLKVRIKSVFKVES